MKFLSDIFRAAKSNVVDGVSQAWPSAYQSSFSRRLRMPEQLEPSYLDEPESLSVWRLVFKIIKIGVLLMVWGFFTYVLVRMATKPNSTAVRTMFPNETLLRKVRLNSDKVAVTLRGPIDLKMMKDGSGDKNVSSVGVRMEWRDTQLNNTLKHSSMWNVYLLEKDDEFLEAEQDFKVLPPEKTEAKAVISLKADVEQPVSLLVVVEFSPLSTDHGVWYAALLLIALLMATTGVAILTALGNRPTLTDIISWVDFETLMLLLGMMIMVAIMSETGIFDWMAVLAYRISMGHPWPLIILLATFTSLLSCVLDNVTMLLLMAPIAIRLCEAIEVQTPLVLMVIVMYANIGGTLTPVGDPPNVIIATNPVVTKDGVDFIIFTMHMLPGVMLALLIGFAVVYLTMRKTLFKLSDRQIELAAEREANRRRLSADISVRANQMRANQSGRQCLKPSANYFETLAHLEAHHRIQDKTLLIKCLVTLVFVVACFLMHSLPFMKGATLGWVAILAAFLLLILAKMDDIEAILDQVEWSALLFLAALFVLAEAVDRLGFIEWLGEKAITVIRSVDERYQTTVALLLILWLSAILSAFVGNVPVTTMILRLNIQLFENDAIRVPLSPLLWALSYGACFGGNGTLIGASANVIAAAVAHQYGYKISFIQFFIYCFPMMLATITIAMVYLLIAHSVFAWHKT
ncbi:P protein isoform X1 [Drosophila ficusphila]|uniref:P protein isoform X1 n=1 Tax=Drosophila ficusphila TaxID=30025 RepID=UPI0007E7DFAC|nr:P protein isoform X1 [Drosophila ficusphila]